MKCWFSIGNPQTEQWRCVWTNAAAISALTSLQTLYFLSNNALSANITKNSVRYHRCEKANGRCFHSNCNCCINLLKTSSLVDAMAHRTHHDDFVMQTPGSHTQAFKLSACIYWSWLFWLITYYRGWWHHTWVSMDKMALYIAIFCKQWYLQAILAPAALWLDLWLTLVPWTASIHVIKIQTFHGTIFFQDIDAPITVAVKTPITRYLWYLTKSLVMFALLHKKLVVKEKMAEAISMLQAPQLTQFRFGKLAFLILNQNIKLHQLIGRQSCLLFDLLNCDCDWLNLPSWPVGWEPWVHSQQVNVTILSDPAER